MLAAILEVSMKKIFVLLLPLAIAACSSTSQPSSSARPSGPAGQVTLSEAERAQIQSVVKAQLANDAATFRTILGQRGADGVTTICGYVNSGAGDTPFVGQLNRGGFALSDIGGAAERTIAVQKSCHGKGIYI
jgi:hypothetical protein